MLVFDLRANAFLQHMVRNIIGCLVYIGKGKYSPEWMSELLESCDRAYACLLYTSDAADERSSVDLGGRRIIKKKKK